MGRGDGWLEETEGAEAGEGAVRNGELRAMSQESAWVMREE